MSVTRLAKTTCGARQLRNKDGKKKNTRVLEFMRTLVKTYC